MAVMAVRQTELVTYNISVHEPLTAPRHRTAIAKAWATWVISLPRKHCNVVILWTRSPKKTYEVLIYNPLTLSRDFDQQLSRHNIDAEGALGLRRLFRNLLARPPSGLKSDQSDEW